MEGCGCLGPVATCAMVTTERQYLGIGVDGKVAYITLQDQGKICYRPLAYRV